MVDVGSISMVWVILTVGDRETELAAAVDSVRENDVKAVVVANGCSVPALEDRPGVRVVASPINLGVPGGRDRGVGVTDEELVGFLDDDAVLSPGVTRRIAEAFATDPHLGAVSLRLVDESGETARRHIPRRGAASADRSGDVTTFLGGASVIRRAAYEQVGGYFSALHYGHEELELAWRLIDGGWSICYLADVEVFHPRTSISRHPDGWRLTGRNRVWIARRTLPWPVAIVHVTAWLVLGVRRAPRGCRRSYVRGWWQGWSGNVQRAPISWRSVWHLGRLGRLPIY
jgi:GT2 family glycosyltransferase